MTLLDDNKYNSGYNCASCSCQFNLTHHLTIEDNNINDINCTLLPADSSMDILILPNILSIELQRCHISFKNTNPFSNSDTPLIRFTFLFQTKNCYLRRKPLYSVSISSQAAKIDKELVINITGDNENTVWVFDHGHYGVSKNALKN